MVIQICSIQNKYLVLIHVYLGEAHRRLDALDLKVQSIEQSSDEEYKRNFSNNNNNRNIQQNGLVLAELQDTVAQLHGIQQCITEENMEKIQDRYQVD